MCSLTCETGHTHTVVTMNRVDAGGIVEAGGGRTLVNVNLTMGPCTQTGQNSEDKSLTQQFPSVLLPSKHRLKVNPVNTGIRSSQ